MGGVFNFEGRSSRRQFWRVFLPALSWLLTFPLMRWLQGEGAKLGVIDLLGAIAWAICGYLILAGLARRLHDIGRSARPLWIILVVVSVSDAAGQSLDLTIKNGIFFASVFLVTVIAAVVGLIPGQTGDNAYGVDPISRPPVNA